MVDTGTARKHLGQRRVAPKGLSRRPRLYLVGEAPGAEEAEQGRPFVGPAGSALRQMLEQAGIDARQLRMANAIPFRPIAYSKDRKPRNRAPTIEEINQHGAAVLADIRRTKPHVIVGLGSSAARLFGKARSIRTVHKMKLQFEGYPLRITFHPAYVRRFGGPDGDLWHLTVADLRRAWKEATVVRLHSI